MPLLITATDALSKAAMSTIGDHVPHMTSAVEASTAVCENLLGTPLLQTTRFDWHTWNTSRLRDGRFEEVKFLLSQGFVADDEPILIYKTDTNLTTPAPVLQDFSNGTLLVEGLDYFFNHEEGSYTILRAVAENTGGLLINYTAGFPAGGDGVLTGTPDWLVQAGSAAAIRWMLAMQSKFNNKERVDLTPEVASIFRFHLNEHIRTKYGRHPIRTVVD